MISTVLWLLYPILCLDIINFPYIKEQFEIYLLLTNRHPDLKLNRAHDDQIYADDRETVEREERREPEPVNVENKYEGQMLTFNADATLRFEPIQTFLTYLSFSGNEVSMLKSNSIYVANKNSLSIILYFIKRKNINLFKVQKTRFTILQHTM